MSNNWTSTDIQHVFNTVIDIVFTLNYRFFFKQNSLFLDMLYEISFMDKNEEEHVIFTDETHFQVIDEKISIKDITDPTKIIVFDGISDVDISPAIDDP